MATAALVSEGIPLAVALSTSRDLRADAKRLMEAWNVTEDSATETLNSRTTIFKQLLRFAIGLFRITAPTDLP